MNYSKRPRQHRSISGTNACLIFLLLAAASGCAPAQSPAVARPAPGPVSGPVSRLFPRLPGATRTPFQPVAPTPTQTLTPTLTPEPVREILFWFDAALPTDLRARMHLPKGAHIVLSAAEANLQIGAQRGESGAQVTWVYALVAPFPTLTDEVSLEEVQRVWRGEAGQGFNGRLLLAENTRAAFAALWGPPGEGRLDVLPPDQLLDAAWDSRSAWALIPFEALEPRWKVLRVNGLSPLQKGLNLEEYPLAVRFGASGSPAAHQMLAAQLGGASLLPPGNWDPGQMTVLVMTGVTALTRATGYKMDTLGTTYPGQDVREWMINADLTHISNEVSFNTACPLANYADTSTTFCSRPEYIELLDDLGTDIVELSGNHNNDWGSEANSYSLGLYQERGWHIFGGGADLEQARQPALVEHNGNRLAFIGCNPVGPPGAWATASTPGAAPCEDYAWLLQAVGDLREQGYLPIVTFQYFESYVFHPSSEQQRDFRAAAEAGAVIVSGSQAHFPQDMEFHSDALIHYGLGNLFFDQMDNPVVGTRREFVDRHVFYGGRHIQTELLTALLEDYARPRPMDRAEREQFLSDIFQSAGW